MTYHLKATSQRTRYGMRVTIENGAYLVTVSSPDAALAWSEAWRAYDRATPDQSGKVAG